MFLAGMLAHLLDNDEKCVEAVREFVERYELPYDTFLDTGEFVCTKTLSLDRSIISKCKLPCIGHGNLDVNYKIRDTVLGTTVKEKD